MSPARYRGPSWPDLGCHNYVESRGSGLSHSSGARCFLLLDARCLSALVVLHGSTVSTWRNSNKKIVLEDLCSLANLRYQARSWLAQMDKRGIGILSFVRATGEPVILIVCILFLEVSGLSARRIPYTSILNSF